MSDRKEEKAIPQTKAFLAAEEAAVVERFIQQHKALTDTQILMVKEPRDVKDFAKLPSCRAPWCSIGALHPGI